MPDRFPNIRRPQVVIIGGPNGSGKSTLASQLLVDEFGIGVYVNADDVAREMDPGDAQSVAMMAGRVVLAELDQLRRERLDFGLETTMSGTSLRHTIEKLDREGYDVHLIYLWQPSVELALGRIRGRVRLGGHDIPEVDIRRRIRRSVRNFELIYRRLVSFWRVYDTRVSRTERGPSLIARGGRDMYTEVFDRSAWNEMQAQSRNEVDDA
jgi:predicted ABC-type ATPase